MHKSLKCYNRAVFSGNMWAFRGRTRKITNKFVIIKCFHVRFRLNDLIRNNITNEHVLNFRDRNNDMHKDVYKIFVDANLTKC